MITAVGIPVYFHYCGGELEKINYVMKSDSCCGEEEDEDAATDDGCCKDENYILKTSTDFTFKQSAGHDFVKTVCDLNYSELFFYPALEKTALQHYLLPSNHVPPELQTDRIIATTVIRI